MEITAIQQQLFQAIKNHLPANASVAEETAKLLDISTDSAYRRMRGDKPVTLDELYKICTHFKISLDQMMNIQTGAFMFQGNILDNKNFKFDQYLMGVINNLGYINSFKENHFFYLCKESPIFHYYHFKELAAFKYFAWMGALLHFPEFKNKKVNFKEYDDQFSELGTRIVHLYERINSVEMWNLESLNSTIRQIEFYRDADLFESEEDVYKVYTAMENMMDHLEKQAEAGYKFAFGDGKKTPLGKYSVYFNEVVIGDNSVMAILDNTKVVFLAHTAMNYIMTRDVVFCEKFYAYLQSLMRSSTLISEVSEKERARFFKRMREKIANRKATLRV